MALKLQRQISGCAIVAALLLMGLNMYAESEPGALPLFLVLASIAWHIITRIRERRQPLPAQKT